MAWPPNAFKTGSSRSLTSTWGVRLIGAQSDNQHDLAAALDQLLDERNRLTRVWLGGSATTSPGGFPPRPRISKFGSRSAMANDPETRVPAQQTSYSVRQPAVQGRWAPAGGRLIGLGGKTPPWDGRYFWSTSTES